MRALALAVILVCVTVWPVLRQPPRDSFPHSTYPMFSENRPPIADIDLVVGVTRAGDRRTLSPELIAGTEEVIVAGSLVRRSVARGAEAISRLCRDAAERVGTGGSREVVAVEVVTDRLDAVEWFAGDHTPLATETHLRCEVPR